MLNETRISNGISIAKIIACFWVFSVHILQIDAYTHFFSKYTYVEAFNSTVNYIGAVTAQHGFLNQFFFMFSLWGWSANITFFALSGVTLWYAFMRKKHFQLNEYISSRLFNFYVPFAIAAIVPIIACRFAHVGMPSYINIDNMFLGATATTHERVFNSALWFIEPMIIFYLIFPIFPVIYRKLGTIGLLLTYFLFWQFDKTAFAGWLSSISMAEGYFIYFITALVVFNCIMLIASWGKVFQHAIYFSCIAIFVWSTFRILQQVYILPMQNNTPQWYTSAYATYIGIMALFSFFTLGYILPKWTYVHAKLRFLSTGTYQVYLYHYIGMTYVLYNNHGKAIAAKIMTYFPAFLSGYYFLVEGLLFLILLIAMSYFDKYLHQFFITPLRKFFSQPILVERKGSWILSVLDFFRLRREG